MAEMNQSLVISSPPTRDWMFHLLDIEDAHKQKMQKNCELIYATVSQFLYVT